MVSAFFLAEHDAPSHGGDPDNPIDQLKYAADFLIRYVGPARVALGLRGALDVITDINAGMSGRPRRLWNAWYMLAAIDDPDIARMHAVLAAYGVKGDAKPFGYFACLVICNRAAGTDGWSKHPRPWGYPDP